MLGLLVTDVGAGVDAADRRIERQADEQAALGASVDDLESDLAGLRGLARELDRLGVDLAGLAAVVDENTRIANENTRITDENTRIANENTRIVDEARGVLTGRINCLDEAMRDTAAEFAEPFWEDAFLAYGGC